MSEKGLLVIGGAAVLLIVLMSNGGLPSVREANPDSLVTADDANSVDVSLDNTGFAEFAAQLDSSDSFNSLVSTTTQIFETDKDRNARMIAVSGLLDGLSFDKLGSIADMYCKIMVGWTENFALITSNFMDNNVSAYEKYAMNISNAKQCKKASVLFETTETNTAVNQGTKSNVLGGILFSRGYTQETKVSQLIRTPVPICSQWGLDEYAAIALYKGMDVATKTNYLAWLTSLHAMPTMLDVLGI
jgi:hypothetical protein